jgi:hypothetical protein
VIQSFLAAQQQPEQLIQQVISIVESVGFKDELGAAPRPPLSKEAAVVQDADRYHHTDACAGCHSQCV